MRKVCLLLAAALLICLPVGCGILKTDEELIQDRVESFVKAYNAGDMEGILECMDAKTRNTYKAAMEIGKSLTGLAGFEVDFSDLFALSIGLIGEGETLKISGLEIDIRGDRATASFDLTLDYVDAVEDSAGSAEFDLVKQDGDWFIVG